MAQLVTCSQELVKMKTSSTLAVASWLFQHRSSFRLIRMAIASENVVNDYDVLGIGGSRREHLRALGNSIVLRQHRELVPLARIDFYEAILAETLQWLKPFSIEKAIISAEPAKILRSLLLNDFKKCFPETTKALGSEFERILDKYNDALPWQGPLLSDHFRYISGFLREESQDEEIVLMAQKEWFLSYLSFNDFGVESSEPGILAINPSLQVLPVKKSAGQLSPGLFVFYSDLATKVVREYKLDVHEAELLDLLHEERKFSEGQLLSFIQSEGISKEVSENWAKKLSNLIKRGIILSSPSGS